jgi:hypothetical protein
MEHYLRECPNSPPWLPKRMRVLLLKGFLAKEKGKAQMHLIELISEG